MTTSNRQQELEQLWKEIEYRGEAWQRGWKLGCPVIPLHELRVYWNSAVGQPSSNRGQLRELLLEHEINALKLRNAELQKRLEQHRAGNATRETVLTPPHAASN